MKGGSEFALDAAFYVLGEIRGSPAYILRS